MSNTTQLPRAYAPPSVNDVVERRLLSELSFVGRKQAEFILDPRNEIAKVRAELHRVYPDDMRALDKRVAGSPQPSTAAAPTRPAAPTHAPAPSTDTAALDAEGRSGRLEEIQQRMGSGAWSPYAKLGVTWDPKTNEQHFGVGVG